MYELLEWRSSKRNDLFKVSNVNVNENSLVDFYPNKRFWKDLRGRILLERILVNKM